MTLISTKKYPLETDGSLVMLNFTDTPSPDLH